MSKRALFILIIIIFLGIFFATIIYPRVFTKTENNFFNINYNKVTKIEVMDGSTGSIITTENKENIRAISNYLALIKVKKDLFSEPSTGWVYRFTIYENNKSYDITFISDKKCYINEKKYTITQNGNVGTLQELYDKVTK